MKKHRSERKGRRSRDLAVEYDTTVAIVREATRAAESAVRATGSELAPKNPEILRKPVLHYGCHPREKMPDKTQAEISFSQLDYTASFKRPILEAWSSPAKLVAAVLDALEPSGYKLDGVETNVQTRKLDEYSFVFRRTTPAFPARSLTLGLEKVAVAAQNLDWTEADHFISGQLAAVDAIRAVGGAEILSQQLITGMHIQLKDRPRKDVTAPLVSSVALRLLDGKADFSGAILLQEKTVVVIDASLAFANGLFVRIKREHPPEASFQQLAETLRKDEERIFDVLGLEGIL